MRAVRILTLSALVLIAPATVLAASGNSPSQSHNDPPLGASGTLGQPAAEQTDAQRLYGNAYQEVAKGQKDLAKGNAKKARKRFDKALNWCESAVSYAPDYHEAWNLIGFTARKLDDYDKSLTAYERCLKIEPTYAPAREYLGEALVELGRIDDAREQLQWLEKLGAKEGAAKLTGLIAAAEQEQTKTATKSAEPEPESKNDE